MSLSEILSITASVLSIISFLKTKDNEREIKKLRLQSINGREIHNNEIIQSNGNVNIHSSNTDK